MQDTPVVLCTDALESPNPAGAVLNVKFRALDAAAGQAVRTEASSGADTIRFVAVGSTTLVCWVAMSVQVPVEPPEVVTTAVTLMVKPLAGQAAAAALAQVTVTLVPEVTAAGRGSEQQNRQGLGQCCRLG